VPSAEPTAGGAAPVRLTMLSSMADPDFEKALDRHVQWRIRDLDLKDRILGKDLPALTDREAARAAEMIRARGLSVHCLSTALFHGELAAGEESFRREHLGRLPRVLELAAVLRPRFVRLLPPKVAPVPPPEGHVAAARASSPWIFGLYRQAAGLIRAAGFEPTVENEVAGSLLASPADVAGFFAELGPDSGVSYTWDVQNMWQSGTFPSLEVYAAVRPRMSYLHLKGGIAEGPERRLCWAAPLEEASWPVLEIVRRAVADGASSVICLNPSHGQRRAKPPGPAGPSDVERDIAFLRENVAEIAR
jgi:sugar phosphate isomerase/epimerase